MTHLDPHPAAPFPSSALPSAPPPFLDPADAELARSATAAGAMALVLSPDGIVLHLRDDKSWIPHPGCWSLFGGAVEEGELPAEAVLRELREELGLVEVECRPLWRVVDAHGDGRLLTVFEARTPVRPEGMVLTEGQALAAFTHEAALELELAPFCRRVLERYASA
ncbi:NUDIX domain-containing protein [Kitasatospora viridis]|uniref:8-oxo-dGTP diphosphatase n=1 Tax=Kitasatospora viridis TaxID=281105 RepID=A0A561T702_9ACTN|nr:NUDIX domain-containing protein [Kitasatospora viridis]TWF82893.1 8-oxo-dGTP diphosphatase [Kitasatospora viridis]